MSTSASSWHANTTTVYGPKKTHTHKDKEKEKQWMGAEYTIPKYASLA